MEEQCGGTVLVEQCNSGTVKVEQYGGTVEHCWWNSGTVLVNSGTVLGKRCRGSVEQ